jgi:hypothetical protein
VCAASDPAVRQNLVEELARHLYLRPAEIEEHGNRGRRRPAARAPSDGARGALPSGERELLRMVLESSREWRRQILDMIDLELIDDPRVRTVLVVARQTDESGDGETDFIGGLIQRTEDPDLGSLVAELCTSSMPEVTDETIRRQLGILIEHQARERARRLAPLIADAEARGDLTELDRLLKEKAKLRQKSAEI